MADWTRRFDSSVRFMRVSRSTGMETERLGGFQPGGSIKRNLDTELKESGSVGHVGSLDIGSDLVRVWMDARFPGGGAESVALGTFLPSVSSRSYDGIASTSTVKLEGRLKELAQSDFPSPSCCRRAQTSWRTPRRSPRRQGSPWRRTPRRTARPRRSTTACRRATTRPTPRAPSSPSSATCSPAPGSTAPAPTQWGRCSCGARSASRSAGRCGASRSGRSARFLRSITDERDTSGVANVVYCVFTGSPSEDAEQETTVGYAIDDDPASPWSVQALGREVVARYDYQEYADQNAANAKAREMLDSTRSVQRVVTVSHVYAPIAIGDAVQIAYTSGGVEETMGVRTMRIQLVDGYLTETEVRAYGRV